MKYIGKMAETESLLSTNCICPLIHVSLKKTTNFFPRQMAVLYRKQTKGDYSEKNEH
jgi:hypothetical protein